MANKKTDGYLYCDELVSGYADRQRWYDRGEEIFREAFAVQVGTAADTEALAQSVEALEQLPDGVLSVCAEAKDGNRYALLFNTGEEAVEIAVSGTDMESGEKKTSHVLSGGDALLLLI